MNHIYNLSFASGLTASIILPKVTDSQAVMNVATAIRGEQCNVVATMARPPNRSEAS